MNSGVQSGAQATALQTLRDQWALFSTREAFGLRRFTAAFQPTYFYLKSHGQLRLPFLA